jgi:hypothetical protein
LEAKLAQEAKANQARLEKIAAKLAAAEAAANPVVEASAEEAPAEDAAPAEEAAPAPETTESSETPAE